MKISMKIIFPLTFLGIIFINIWCLNPNFDLLYPKDNAEPLHTVAISIGTAGTYSYNFPYFYWWHNGLSEIIYMSEELEEQGVSEGLLTELILYYTESASVPDLFITIWVGETTDSSPPEDWIPAGELTLAYDGLLNHPGYSGELHLPFIEPYSYNGNNLVIMIHRPWHYWCGGNLCFYYTETLDYPDRAIFKYSDIIEFDPFNPPLDPFYCSQVPNSTLIFDIENNESEDNVMNPNPVELYDVFPNPFNPTATIFFTITKQADVILSVYNLKGQIVDRLEYSRLNPGDHYYFWDTSNSDSDLKSGVYFINLKVNGGDCLTKKCLLLK